MIKMITKYPYEVLISSNNIKWKYHKSFVVFAKTANDAKKIIKNEAPDVKVISAKKLKW